MAGTGRSIEGEMERLHVTQEEVMLRAGKMLVELFLYPADNLHLDHNILIERKYCCFNRLRKLYVGVRF
ncbi:hypothetical protein D3C81_1725350 [compost metagenome]